MRVITQDDGRGRRRGPRVAVALLAVAGILVSAGCGGPAASSTNKSGEHSLMEPTGTPSPSVTPAAPRRGDRPVTGHGFSLSVDPAFQRANRTASNGEPVLVLTRPSGVPQVGIGVTVFREPDPKSNVIAESYALEVSKRTIAQATDIRRSRLTWPGATDTVLVQWTQQLPTSEGRTVATRYWQLNAQISPKLILIVVGFAPVSVFDTSGVAEAISSFRPGGS